MFSSPPESSETTQWSANIFQHRTIDKLIENVKYCTALTVVVNKEKVNVKSMICSCWEWCGQWSWPVSSELMLSVWEIWSCVQQLQITVICGSAAMEDHRRVWRKYLENKYDSDPDLQFMTACLQFCNKKYHLKKWRSEEKRCWRMSRPSSLTRLGSLLSPNSPKCFRKQLKIDFPDLNTGE